MVLWELSTRAKEIRDKERWHSALMWFPEF